ncbi:isocitrate lyase/PEP mutase family protein [Streptomyces wuyuanensis]|uniref:isocitrate lyase/PEP mutase family protein n=1 Tax=Streptomyces wuyuanensis TaxID=1196353 RepID=UPI0034415734
MVSAARFRALHHGRAPGDPLVLPGPWDALSARVLADAGFPALATPSAAVAASLGYEDGRTPADEMFAAVARIVRSVDVPVSADVESGYGLPAGELVARVLETGAVGINLEDSGPGKALVEPQRQADRLAQIRAEAGDALFVNARVDTFLLGTADPGPAIERARLYVAAGADCVYPIFAPEDALPRLRREITGPINAMASPGAPGAPALGRLGVTRVTFGDGLLPHAFDALRECARALRG